MREIAHQIRHLSNRIRSKQTRGQGLVEFALISIPLFFLLFGILEMGRMLFIWSQISSAAEEGARYGIVRPGQIIDPCCQGSYPNGSTNANPCNIVAHARARVVLIDPNAVGVEVGYDDGEGAHPAVVSPFNVTPPDFRPAVYRVVVTSTYQFHFVVGILDKVLPNNGLTLSMVAARTIQDGPPYPATCSDLPPQ